MPCHSTCFEFCSHSFETEIWFNADDNRWSNDSEYWRIWKVTSPINRHASETVMRWLGTECHFFFPGLSINMIVRKREQEIQGIVCEIVKEMKYSQNVLTHRYNIKSDLRVRLNLARCIYLISQLLVLHELWFEKWICQQALAKLVSIRMFTDSNETW